MLKTELGRQFEMPFGTQVRPDGVAFNIWAPTAKSIELVIYGDQEKIVEMNRRADGWCSAFVSGARAGTAYHYFVNGELRVPDPASRAQVEDVHGPSIVIDPNAYQWKDSDWRGRPWSEAVVYELHVGTFSPSGTFRGVVEKLDYLKELGVTAVELMPVADFPGERNWGYDGVLPFAPDRRYGSVDDLKFLVEECHRRGLMIFLDVVYNHFGPEGNYLHTYAEKFFNPNHQTPWGAGINFDAEGNEVVREFFISNSLFWLKEYNFDGLRFDAVHAIKDDSENNFLMQLGQRIRERMGHDRFIHLILENDDNQSSLLERSSTTHSAMYFTAQWNDDYHHCMHVLLTDETSGYYADFGKYNSHASTTAHLVRALCEGFAYQGEPSPFRAGARRGEESKHLPPNAFVNFIQNHDQIGNRAFGERMAALTSEPALHAGLTLLLLAPQIPLLYMGEEWGSKTPFLFFCNLGADLAPLVTKGRREEFAKFEQFSDPQVRERIPDPSAEATFVDSRLNWDELKQVEHQRTKNLTAQLLNLRQEKIVPYCAIFEGECTTHSELITERAFFIEWQARDGRKLICLANLSNEPVDCDMSRLKSAQKLFAVGETRSDGLSPWTVVWWTQNAN